MSVSEAREADRHGDIVNAAALYEAALQAEEWSIEAVLDLIVLYWQATDPGEAAARHLSRDFLDIAGRRIPELLREAQRRYPGHGEVAFWTSYIAWADLGDEIDESEYRRLLREGATLTPAVYLFSASDGKEARPEALQLLELCRGQGTSRAKYIVSVIEARLRREKGYR